MTENKKKSTNEFCGYPIKSPLSNCSAGSMLKEQQCRHEEALFGKMPWWWHFNQLSAMECPEAGVVRPRWDSEKINHLSSVTNQSSWELSDDNQRRARESLLIKQNTSFVRSTSSPLNLWSFRPSVVIKPRRRPTTGCTWNQTNYNNYTYWSDGSPPLIVIPSGDFHIQIPEKVY